MQAPRQGAPTPVLACKQREPSRRSRRFEGAADARTRTGDPSLRVNRGRAVSPRSSIPAAQQNLSSRPTDEVRDAGEDMNAAVTRSLTELLGCQEQALGGGRRVE